MRFHYISPSLLPSRAANAVHVTLQCDALARAGAELTLYAKRTIPDKAALPALLHSAYGVNTQSWRVVSYHSRFRRGDVARIAALAMLDLARTPRPDAVLSRNVYAAYALAPLQRRALIYEAHELELGARKAMQRAIMTSPSVITVAISQLLVDHLTRHHGVAPARPLVLPDAAPAGMQPIRGAGRRRGLAGFGVEGLEKWPTICGYFGHLYPGRGIEIIEKLAAARPAVLFLVFGGNEADVLQRRAANARANVVFVGHVPHRDACEAMGAVDALLMPYQSSVSIGVPGRDTAGWMSPMKMFEYLGSGVPIISSDLPVLREILEDGQNALLVPPADADAWVAALDRLVADPPLASRLGDRGHADYRERYTWDARAVRLLSVAEPF